tara:strand:- start:3530 stop:4003 length:474 start_codon:yes stop_codon:yes gene_type:complete
MLKTFNDGVCIQTVSSNNYDFAKQEAEAYGWVAVESNNINEEILVDGKLHEVSRPWAFDENIEVTITGFKLVDGAYQYTYTERDITAENEAKETERLAEKAVSERATRNQLLAETDWTANSDVTMSDGMTTYRQALRDVPAQEGFPLDITWPTKPEE